MAWYDIGSISVTNGSATVTGSGTDFISGVQVGEGLYIGGDLYEIGVINSSTQLTLSDAYLGSTATGQAYKIIPTQSLVADLSSGVADLISDFADVRDYAGNGKFNDGTQASPAITFTQDQNNGLYRIGSDNWGMSAGGQKQVDISTTDVELNYSGSKKLATTATGVDVTGTVTADGLVVESNTTDVKGLIKNTLTGGSRTATLDIVPQNDGAYGLSIQTSGGSGTGVFKFNNKNTMKFDLNNDVSFYEDTGTTAKMVWDASAENLSIGNIEGLPNGSLSLKTTASGHAISLEENSGTERWQLGVNAAGDLEFINSADSDASIVFDDSGNVGIGTASPNITGYATSSTVQTISTLNSTGALGVLEISGSRTVNGQESGIISFHNNSNAVPFAEIRAGRGPTDSAPGDLRMYTGASERARIDSSGNLLVGKTVADNTTAGIRLLGSEGFASFVRDAAEPMVINRLTNDGELIEFRKDGATVGSIGTQSGALTFANAARGFKMDGSSFEPIYSAGTEANGVNDIGVSANRWRNLYLSGGVYLGGTGAANKLDDYEEGTWTPTTTISSGSVSLGEAIYTKIGRTVHIDILYNTSATIASGNQYIVFTVPFLQYANNCSNVGVVTVYPYGGLKAGIVIDNTGANGTSFYAGWNTTVNIPASNTIRISLTYQANA